MNDQPLMDAREWASNNPQVAAVRQSTCLAPLEMTQGARDAFDRRQEILTANEKWPNSRWYNDEDFCRAYNTAVAMAERAEAAEAMVAEWERLFPNHKGIVREAAQSRLKERHP